MRIENGMVSFEFEEKRGLARSVEKAEQPVGERSLQRRLNW